MDTNEPIVILLSGGIKGLVAAMRVLTTSDPHFLYCEQGNAAAEAERRAVHRIADALAVKLHVVKLPAPAEIAAVESVAKAAEASDPPKENPSHGGRLTPGSMLAMLGVAQQLARRVKAGSVVCGASEACGSDESKRGPDHTDPQARRLFFHAAATAMEFASPAKLRTELELPLIDMTRLDIILAGMRAGAPFELTWSCFYGGFQPCGECGGCSARAMAFAALGMKDPVTRN